MSINFCIVYSCFCSIFAEFSSCHKDSTASKAQNIYYLAFYGKNLYTTSLHTKLDIHLEAGARRFAYV